MSAADKWKAFWGHKDWTPGKEEEESREHLANFFAVMTDSVNDGSLFRLGLFSLKKGILPNGYTYELSIKQGVKPDERHEWSDPKESPSMTRRKIRRCKHCKRAFANRIANARCERRCDP